MFEYEDYAAEPTRANASEFITRALEDNYDPVSYTHLDVYKRQNLHSGGTHPRPLCCL